MKIAIFGIGFLGTKLMNILSKNHEVIGASTKKGENIEKIDATNKQEVKSFLSKHKPEIVIDTIALTSSVACEKNQELAKKLNYETAKNIAESCHKISAKMVFISSSYLFDGKKGNYNEKDNPNSTIEYSKNKILAEKEVLKLENGIVLRVDLMYGYNGKEKPNGIFGTVLSNEDIKLGNPNQMRQPLFVDDVAKVVIQLIEKKQDGIFHVAGSDKIKTKDFIEKLERLVRDNSNIKTIDGELLVKPLKDSTLNISKIKNLGIKTTSLSESLKIMKTQLNQS